MSSQPPDSPPPPYASQGLVFFAPDAPPGHRRRRLIFVVIATLASISVIWPVYTFFGHATPLILGLPLSLAWPTLWLCIVFAALLWLYRAESLDQPRP